MVVSNRTQVFDPFSILYFKESINMKHVNFRFVIAVLFLAGTSMFVVHCFAGSGWNYQCITGAGSNTCNSSGNAMCSTLGVQNGMICYYCTGSNSLPPRFCVAREGWLVPCVPIGTASNACNGNPMRRGTCRDGACVNTTLTGNNCGSGNYVPCALL